LYVRIYLSFVVVAAVALVTAAVASTVGAGTRSFADAWGEAVTRLSALDPGAPDYLGEVQALGAELDADVSVFDPSGALLGVAGRPLPPGPAGPFRDRGGVAVRIPLASGGSFAFHRRDGRERLGWFLGVSLLALAVGSWPLARRITRRLERVEAAAARWGGGDLGARVVVEGGDEVASLARTFNAAADRVEDLVAAQRRVLASASHELRSPLARVRLALELVADAHPSDVLTGAIRDVEVLDDTVAELLTAGRLVAMDRLEDAEEVDLAALVRGEAVRVGARVSGVEAVTVRGNPRLLGALVRNLLENAVRHGAPPIEVELTTGGLVVSDAGAGVPDAEKDKIFEPFYRPAGHDEGRDGGVGLGLHLCAQIARVHGGGVRCLDRPGGGSRFEVTLRA
jgi:signal transduction histidine kinase